MRTALSDRRNEVDPEGVRAPIDDGLLDEGGEDTQPAFQAMVQAHVQRGLSRLMAGKKIPWVVLMAEACFGCLKSRQAFRAPSTGNCR